jgi:uncharacterized membrane protein
VPAWFLSAALAAVFIAVHYSLVRAASGRVGDALGALVLEASAALGIAAYYAVMGRRDDTVATTPRGLVCSVVSGLAISFASILMFGALRKGGPVATTGTVMLGGGVTLSAFAAPLVFGETMTARRALGIALGIAAMAVLSRDR